MSRSSHEIYVPSFWFVEQEVFPYDTALYLLAKKHNFKAEDEGYPVFAVLRALAKEVRDAKLSSEKRDQDEKDIDKAIKRENLQAKRIANKLKMKELILRSMAVDRMRTSLMAIANKVRHAVKLASPRCVGHFNVTDVENILIEQYNKCIEEIERDADSLEEWESYGADTTFVEEEDKEEIDF